MKLPAVVYFAITLSNGCKPAVTLNHIPDPAITGKYWKLDEIKDFTLDTGFLREPSINLRSNSNFFKGQGGCNSFSGIYHTGTPSEIHFTEIKADQIKCQASKTEERFLKILSSANRYEMNKDSLYLYEGKKQLAKFEVVWFH